MKAIAQEKYGSYDTLRPVERERPTPGPGEVVIRVAAAGVDPGQWHLMTGLPRAGRLAFGLRAPAEQIRGRDVAGRIETLGTGVSDLAVGDEVFGTCRGAFAEYAVAKATSLVPRPPNVTPGQAAATPTSGYTALQALAAGGVSAGQQVLIIGAGGGVGTFLVQMAVARGASVTGVCSAGKADMVRALGADRVIDYARDGLGDGYDVILDLAGLRALRVLRAALAPRGTLVMVGGEDDGRWIGGAVTRQLRATVIRPFTRQRLPWLLALERREDLETLAEMLAAGVLTPSVDRTFPLAEAPAALRYVMDGHARGKVVVVPTETP